MTLQVDNDLVMILKLGYIHDMKIQLLTVRLDAVLTECTVWCSFPWFTFNCESDIVWDRYGLSKDVVSDFNCVYIACLS